MEIDYDTNVVDKEYFIKLYDEAIKNPEAARKIISKLHNDYIEKRGKNVKNATFITSFNDIKEANDQSLFKTNRDYSNGNNRGEEQSYLERFNEKSGFTKENTLSMAQKNDFSQDFNMPSSDFYSSNNANFQKKIQKGQIYSRNDLSVNQNDFNQKMFKQQIPEKDDTSQSNDQFPSQIINRNQRQNNYEFTRIPQGQKGLQNNNRPLWTPRDREETQSRIPSQNFNDFQRQQQRIKEIRNPSETYNQIQTKNTVLNEINYPKNDKVKTLNNQFNSFPEGQEEQDDESRGDSTLDIREEKEIFPSKFIRKPQILESDNPDEDDYKIENARTNQLWFILLGVLIFLLFGFIYVSLAQHEEGESVIDIVARIPGIILGNMGKILSEIFQKFWLYFFFIIIAIFFFGWYLKKKEKEKRIQEIFEELKRQLKEIKKGRDPTKRSLSERNIIKEFSRKYGITQEEFSKKYLPILRKRRERDRNIRLSENIADGKRQVFWEWKD